MTLIKDDFQEYIMYDCTFSDMVDLELEILESIAILLLLHHFLMIGVGISVQCVIVNLVMMGMHVVMLLATLSIVKQKMLLPKTLIESRISR